MDVLIKLEDEREASPPSPTPCQEEQWGVGEEEEEEWEDDDANLQLARWMADNPYYPHKGRRRAVEGHETRMAWLNRMRKENDLPNLRGNEKMANKVYSLNRKYQQAKEWMEEEGQQVLKNQGPLLYKEELMRICPWFFILDGHEATSVELHRYKRPRSGSCDSASSASTTMAHNVINIDDSSSEGCSEGKRKWVLGDREVAMREKVADIRLKRDELKYRYKRNKLSFKEKDERERRKHEKSMFEHEKELERMEIEKLQLQLKLKNETP